MKHLSLILILGFCGCQGPSPAVVGALDLRKASDMVVRFFGLNLAEGPIAERDRALEKQLLGVEIEPLWKSLLANEGTWETPVVIKRFSNAVVVRFLFIGKNGSEFDSLEHTVLLRITEDRVSYVDISRINRVGFAKAPYWDKRWRVEYSDERI